MWTRVSSEQVRELHGLVWQKIDSPILGEVKKIVRQKSGKLNNKNGLIWITRTQTVFGLLYGQEAWDTWKKDKVLGTIWTFLSVRK